MPGSTIRTSFVLRYTKSVESNASFPMPGSTFRTSCVCCNVLRVLKVMRVFQCLGLH